VNLVRGGAQYALAADSEDLTLAMPRLYFLAWGLEPFVPKVRALELWSLQVIQLVGE
jgi:hypothetical protein